MTADVGGQNRKFEFPYLPWKLQAVNGVDRSLKRLGLLRRNDRYKTPCPVASSSLQCRLSREKHPTFNVTSTTSSRSSPPLDRSLLAAERSMSVILTLTSFVAR
ncbi:Pisatin demethylase [Fusarium oxysporum f. sp. albedinis]|nr:Pisatin demethylase [Fusarium oxysporum f. sp. albedinis]